MYKKYLEGFRAEIIYGDKEKILNIIRESMKESIPLHILYLTNNVMSNGENVLHYSALIGFDEKDDTFTIADPYGSIKILYNKEFFDTISFRNKCLPDDVKKNIPSNLMIRIIKCEDK